MKKYAQTNLQLYNQLLSKNYLITDLKFIKKAYEFSIRLFAGKYQRNGKDFICHNVGTASILCMHNMPAKIIAAGLLHNAYGNGNFGVHNKNLKFKRKFIKKRLGEEIENYLYEFYKVTYIHETNWRRTFLANPSSVETLEDNERHVLLILLADILEHNIYSGYNSFDNSKSLKTTTKFIEENGESIVKLAQHAGYPDLANELETNFKQMKTQTSHPILKNKMVPDIKIIIPKSYDRKLSAIIKESVHSFFNSYGKQKKKISKKMKNFLLLTLSFKNK